jgi:hypothetical protein
LPTISDLRESGISASPKSLYNFDFV